MSDYPVTDEEYSKGTSPQVCLDGYYGAGNLGDDILMIVSYSILRQIFSPEEILVIAREKAYVKNMLGEQCHLQIELSSPFLTEALVLGGGGLFFDFAKGGRVHRARQFFLHKLGVVRLQKITHILRGANRKKSSSNEKKKVRIALGIGIGPFAKGSSRELSAALELSKYDLVIVRDAMSLDICRSWRTPNKVIQATDIAFMHDRWMANIQIPNRKQNSPKKIAVVVRDWPFSLQGAKYLTSVINAISLLKAAGYEIRFVSFNPKNDALALKELKKEDVLCWNPNQWELKEFLQELSLYDIMITSRAHGAIIGACLGIPSVCVEIEPKLLNVQQILAPTAEVWKPPFKISDLIASVENICRNYVYLADALPQVVESNRIKADLAAEELKRVLRIIKRQS